MRLGRKFITINFIIHACVVLISIFMLKFHMNGDILNLIIVYFFITTSSFSIKVLEK